MNNPNQPFVSTEDLNQFPLFKSFQSSSTSNSSSRDKVKSNGNVDGNSNATPYCDLCQVPITSTVVYETHIKGKKHQTFLAAKIVKDPQYQNLAYTELPTSKVNTHGTSNENDKTPIIPTKRMNCRLCNVTCNSQQMFDNHIIGKKHQMKLKTNNKSSNRDPLSAPVPVVTSVPTAAPAVATAPPPPLMEIKPVEPPEKTSRPPLLETPVTETVEPEAPAPSLLPPSPEFFCSTCRRYFKNESELTRHVKISHYQPPSNSAKPKRKRETNFKAQNHQPKQKQENPNMHQTPSPWHRSSSNHRQTYLAPNQFYPPVQQTTPYDNYWNSYDDLSVKRTRYFSNRFENTQNQYSNHQPWQTPTQQNYSPPQPPPPPPMMHNYEPMPYPSYPPHSMYPY